MNAYDPGRDPVRKIGRVVRWSGRWLAVPILVGVFISAHIDVHALPLLGGERETAVLLLDGQAYFGHLDESGEDGTLVLRDVYYFQNAQGSATNVAVTLVKRGTEAHQPADSMRINRDKVLAVERVGSDSLVARAIAASRAIDQTSAPLVSLNRPAIASPSAILPQRTAAEHSLARGFAAAADQLAKLNQLVLPISQAEAEAISQKALADLRTVRREALGAIATVLRMSAADKDEYVRLTEGKIEGQSFSAEAGVLLAPDLSNVVTRAGLLYTQFSDAAAKQLTQARPSPSPSATAAPSPTATARPSASPSPTR